MLQDGETALDILWTLEDERVVRSILAELDRS